MAKRDGTARRSRGAAALALAVLGTACTISAASAECLRQIINRSPFVLTARRDGGPPVTILPGHAVQVRLSHPGQLDFAAYCSVPGPNGARSPITQASFSYEAVIDRCYIELGGQIFVPQLGRGFIGLQGTAPFTVNNPRQGDVVLGPFATDACPAVLSRGG
ncbi:hypothetical protein [Methylobacterium persicinum]|uniref:Uncharacterized protein n=1 Tax=Methylobacterium persicinum TaxID=374426 RepID=A0ABU0HNZ7_9HYPH|nr:hypothetical protein [Methylobacterium persicinum]MDQ0444048.1 hypothetical protein [Methylobacterium persicinum]GJE38404.1 hypothetical protein KHHGKMAE_2476 [Methylobacterium persicinum]